MDMKQKTDAGWKSKGLAVGVPMLLVLGVLAVVPVEAGHGIYTLGNDATAVAAGVDHTCVLKATGNVDCYGYNGYGQSADYTGGDATAVAAGVDHTCVLKATGNVDCYGRNLYGEAADYTGGDATAVAAGRYHTCVLKATGNVDCYGDNGSGQSADYTGGGATAVAAGVDHTCVLKATGNVDCYGDNGSGQSADYTGGDATAVAAGRYHTCVLKATGNVDCYGDNGYGQLGGNDGSRYLLYLAAVHTPPMAPVGQSVGSTVVYDDGGNLCVDLVLEGESPRNLGCVNQDLLGPADALVPRGETEILIVDVGDQSVDDLEVAIGYHYDDARLFPAATLLGGSVEAWTPFAPGDQQWFLDNGDDVDFFVSVTVYQDGQEVESVPISIPYLGQALAAAEKTAGTL